MDIACTQRMQRLSCGLHFDKCTFTLHGTITVGDFPSLRLYEKSRYPNSLT